MREQRIRGFELLLRLTVLYSVSLPTVVASDGFAVVLPAFDPVADAWRSCDKHTITDVWVPIFVRAPPHISLFSIHSSAAAVCIIL